MNGDLGTAAGRGDLVRLALRLIVEEALESEVADALGRERYARGEGEKAGYRNGYRTGKVKTAEGAVEYAVLQARETLKSFRRGCARRFRPHRGARGLRRSEALRSRAVDARHRGRLHRRAGPRLLSRAAVSEITQRLWAEYEAFRSVIFPSMRSPISM